MYQYSGKCSCGKVAIEFSSSQDISSYTPRKCDCDYCTERDIEYLSDPQGQITFISKTPLCHEKQGSEQANFLLCAKCHAVVGVCYIDIDVSVGSVNARLLDEFDKLRGSLVVSPKALDKTEKVKRWGDLWSPVQIIIA